MRSARACAHAANDHAAEPLSVAVQGDEVLIVGPGGLHHVMSVRAAQISVGRLQDAIAIAQGRMPTTRR
ncbi:MAG TPA: hypothetical protein VF459_07070 [Caulobacteraceae bacterium]